MNKYELMVIVDAQKSQPEKEDLYKQTTDAVTKVGGKVINAQVWLDKHKLAFSIKKKNEGTYYLVNFESETSFLAKIKELLRLNEEVLRYLIIKNN